MQVHVVTALLLMTLFAAQFSGEPGKTHAFRMFLNGKLMPNGEVTDAGPANCGQTAAKRWQPRTPAMAAGLTDHVWTLREVLLFRVPPRPQPSQV